MRVLLTWLGLQDPWHSAKGRPTGPAVQMPSPRPAEFVDGPILTFLANSDPFDVLYLLYDPPMLKSGAHAALTRTLTDLYPAMDVQPLSIPIHDPRLYEPLYRLMRAACEQARAQHGARADYNVLLSPGTPQMHAVWVLLVKTVFRAEAWQVSDRPHQATVERAQIPFDPNVELVAPAVDAALRKRPRVGTSAADMVCVSPASQRALNTALQAAASDTSILLLGETGVGKERFAHAIHHHSPRARQPFVVADCTTIPDNLIESEFFGHVRGSFSGATTDRIGLFEAAQGGTLFLDEIGDLPLSMQQKLLRVLQEHTFRRVGTTEQVPVNIRVIAATHQRLDQLVREKLFREDLYYRLSVVPIEVPPLRERPEDIYPLFEHFLTKENTHRQKRGALPLQLAIPAIRRLESHPWPGNVRELENFVARMGALVPHPRVTLAIVDSLLPPIATSVVRPKDDRPLRQALEDLERQLIQNALKEHKTQAKAAVALGLHSQQALQRRIAKLRLRP